MHFKFDENMQNGANDCNFLPVQVQIHEKIN